MAKDNDTKMINFDKQKYEALRKAYDKAVADKKESFMFEGNEWVTTYAKYALEYLEPKFKN